VNKHNPAIILVNLGTPDRPDEDSIRRYLKQFLSDPRVVDLPRWLWLPILNQIILRFRPPKLVEKYEMIWGTHDGPIRSITQALASRVQSLMPDIPVHVAMTYGQPSIPDVLEQVKEHDELIVLPLYPQYAGATTGSVMDAFSHAIKDHQSEWQVRYIEDYSTDEGYISALADSVRRSKAYRSRDPYVVFSFHGIPQAQADRGDPYPQRCEATAALIAAHLELPADRWQLTYQSRFGPAAWLQPYTDKTMEALPDKNIEDVLVACPGFSVDCLETIEEIKEQNCEIFLEAGGREFSYVKALNASWSHANALADIIRRRLADQG
jgi:ferrochelatase